MQFLHVYQSNIKGQFLHFINVALNPAGSNHKSMAKPGT